MYLGCPGAGKGSLCSKLAAEYNECHLSVGDLLRATILDRESTERRELTPYIRSGSLVPPTMLLRVLRRSVAQNIHETLLFLLIDGFSRLLQQGIEFETEVGVHPFRIFVLTLVRQAGSRSVSELRQRDCEAAVSDAETPRSAG
jgi:adenylate kinase family enzyme